MVRICRKLDSETLYLPELKPLIGKTVEIIVQEERAGEITPGTGDWVAAQRAAQRLQETGYDFDAWHQQREYELSRAREPPRGSLSILLSSSITRDRETRRLSRWCPPYPLLSVVSFVPSFCAALVIQNTEPIY
jgi:hypothetical protein